MNYQFDVKIGNRTLRLSNTVQSAKQVFEELSFWQELPEKCNFCGSADLGLNHAVRGTQKYNFYAVKCYKCKAEMKIGQGKDEKTLFPKEWERPDQRQNQPNQDEPRGGYSGPAEPSF